MAKFISVLVGDLKLDFWKAVQQADSQAELEAQDSYRAGNHFLFDKNSGDRFLKDKQITEENSGKKATAREIQLADSDAKLQIAFRPNFNRKLLKAFIKSKNLLSLLFFMIILSSCHYTGKLTRRYKSITPKKIENIGTYVKVDAYVIEKEGQTPTPKKTLFDLAPRAQEEIIRQIGINESESSKLITALTSPLSSTTAPNIEFIDFTKFEKRVVVTIKNIAHAPADRISKINVNLKLDEKLRLLSCNRLQTEFQTIDLGKLNFSNSNSAEIAGNLSTGLTTVAGTTGNLSNEITNTLLNGNNVTNTGNSVSKSVNGSTSTNTETGTAAQGLTGKLSASRSFAEEVLLKQRMVVLNASITANNLSLYQESISGIDLTGNIIADIVFDGNSDKEDVVSDKVFSFSELFEKDNKPNTADKVKVKETIINYFNFTNDLTAEISFDADYRKVVKGHRTISESDDVIELLYGSHAPVVSKKALVVSKKAPVDNKKVVADSTKAPVDNKKVVTNSKKEPSDVKKVDTDSTEEPLKITLLRKEQLMPKFWVMELKDKKKSKFQVQITSPLGTTGILQFNNQSDFKSFMSWLIESTKVTPLKADAQGNFTLALAGGYKLLMPNGFSTVDDLEIRVLKR